MNSVPPRGPQPAISGSKWHFLLKTKNPSASGGFGRNVSFSFRERPRIASRSQATSQECCARQCGRRRSIRQGSRRLGSSSTKLNRTLQPNRDWEWDCHPHRGSLPWRCDAGRHRCWNFGLALHGRRAPSRWASAWRPDDGKTRPRPQHSTGSSDPPLAQAHQRALPPATGQLLNGVGAIAESVDHRVSPLP